MGQSSSTNSGAANYNINENISDVEIRQRIDKLFLNNKNNPMSDLTYPNDSALSDGMATATVTPTQGFTPVIIPQAGGINKRRTIRDGKVTPRRQRYAQYNMDNYIINLLKRNKSSKQTGGGCGDDMEYNQKGGDQGKYEELSPLSELDRLKEYLVSQRNRETGQRGGDFATLDDGLSSTDFNIPSPSSESENQLYNLINLMKGGNDNVDSEEPEEGEGDEETVESDEEEKEEEEKEEEEEEEEDSDKKKKPFDSDDLESSDGDNEQKETVEGEEETEEAGYSRRASRYEGIISSTSDMNSPINKVYSGTSSLSSNEINVEPFYSSENTDYEFRHPYAKSRFN